MNETIDTNKDIDRLLNIFGGADGGGDFVRLKAGLAKFAADADNGDVNAREILNFVHKTTRFFDYLTNPAAYMNKP